MLILVFKRNLYRVNTKFYEEYLILFLITFNLCYTCYGMDNIADVVNEKTNTKTFTTPPETYVTFYSTIIGLILAVIYFIFQLSHVILIKIKN